MIPFFALNVNFLLDFNLDNSVESLDNNCKDHIHQEERPKKYQKAAENRSRNWIYSHQVFHNLSPVVHCYYLENSEDRVPEVLELSDVILDGRIILNLVIPN